VKNTVWSADVNGLTGLTVTAGTLSLTTLDGETVVKVQGSSNTDTYVDLDLSATPALFYGGATATVWSDTSVTANLGMLVSADGAFAAYTQGGYAPTAWAENNALVSRTVEKFMLQFFAGGTVADVQFSPGYQGTWIATPPTYPTPVVKIRFRFTKKSTFTPCGYLQRLSLTSGRKSRVCITFDDGYESAFRWLKPVLDKYNLKGTWGIITNKTDTPSFMTRYQLATLYNEGHELVPHGPLGSITGDIVNNYLADPDPVASAVADVQYHRNNLRAWGLLRVQAESCYIWPRGAHARYVDDLAYDNALRAIGITHARSASVTRYSYCVPQWPNQLMLPIVGHSQGGQ
jgi:hypothetical protein